MAALTVTATQVVRVDGETEDGILGGTVTAGQSVYKNASDRWVAARANTATTAGSASKVGVALNGGASGQPVRVQKGGTINMGAGAVQPAIGIIYCVSDAVAGEIVPSADLGSGDYQTVLGVGIGSNKIKLQPIVSGVAI